MSSHSSDPGPSSDPISPDDALPPVEAPSAGFLMQLFIVPAIIVLCVFGVAMLISWMANKRSDPKQYIAMLQRSGPGRWQAAQDLSTVLRDTRNTEFKRDRVAAQQLAALLQSEMDSERVDDNSLKLRGFLCRALGEFQVDDGLPVLLTAASVQRVNAEVPVRQAAIEAIAVLADNLTLAEPPGTLDRPEVEAALKKLLTDQETNIRGAAAFASGVVGSPALLDRLEGVLGDAEDDVRYNAATGLARYGRERCLPVLEEMLDLRWESPDRDQIAHLTRKQREELTAREYRQIMVFSNGLRALEQLVEANPEVDLEDVLETLDGLDQSKFPSGLTQALEKARASIDETLAHARQQAGYGRND